MHFPEHTGLKDFFPFFDNLNGADSFLFSISKLTRHGKTRSSRPGAIFAARFPSHPALLTPCPDAFLRSSNTSGKAALALGIAKEATFCRRRHRRVIDVGVYV